MSKFTKPKIAIIHDSLRYFVGAERVLEVLHQAWPDAPIYTSTVCWEKLGPFRRRIQRLKPITSWAQRVPFFRFYPFLYRYLLPLVWHSFDLSDYDIVVTVSHAQMSHLVKVTPKALLVSYCLSPARHLYGYETDFPWQKIKIIRFFANWGNKILLQKDQAAAKRVDIFLAASKEVAQRIKRFYQRYATVICPPLSWRLEGKVFPGNYYLVVSRLSPMKHVDLMIAAVGRLGAKLKIVGTGPEEKYLRSLSNKKIEILGQVSDKRLTKLYAHCLAVICAARDEDFGIVPLEAMSFGKPVVAYQSGGYKETVIEGKTGIFFSELSTQSLVQALRRLESLSIEPTFGRRRAQQFSPAVFILKMRRVVLTVWRQKLLATKENRMLEYDL